ncbi:hypothetical protein AB0F91_28385 [Amycolatopsis sp. NPDC023774]
MSSALPAPALLDLVLALTYGNIAQAGNAALWPDSQWTALATAVSRLVAR